MKYDESVSRALASRQSAFHAAEEHITGLNLRSGLGDWYKNVVTEYRKELSNVG